jgi:hypothetical protein
MHCEASSATRTNMEVSCCGGKPFVCPPAELSTASSSCHRGICFATAQAAACVLLLLLVPLLLLVLLGIQDA